MIRPVRSSLLLVALLVAACGVGDDPAAKAAHDQAATQLAWLKAADPVADAQTAIARGDPPLVGLYGYARSFPGAEAVDPESCATRMIEGTGDVLDRATEEMNRRGERYAFTYNQLVLPHARCRSVPLKADDRSLP